MQFVDNASDKKYESKSKLAVVLTRYVHLIYSFYKYCFIPFFVTLSVNVATKPCFSLSPFIILKMFCFAVELRVSLL